MDPFLTAALIASGALFFVNGYQQRKRIFLLARHLAPLQVEKLMETLTQGYLRALGERETERQAQVFAVLEPSEAQLATQFAEFAAKFATVPADQAKASSLPVCLPFAAQVFPQATFDMRALLAVHANGLARALQPAPGTSARDRAFLISAEIFLMQHSCHWFCKSRTIASARMQARHHTSYQQLLAAIAPETRRAYLAVLQG